MTSVPCRSPGRHRRASARRGRDDPTVRRSVVRRRAYPRPPRAPAGAGDRAGRTPSQERRREVQRVERCRRGRRHRELDRCARTDPQLRGDQDDGSAPAGGGQSPRLPRRGADRGRRDDRFWRVHRLQLQARGPRRGGSDAYVATGTTVTQDVPDEALAIGRSRQENKPDYVDWSTQRSHNPRHEMRHSLCYSLASVHCFPSAVGQLRGRVRRRLGRGWFSARRRQRLRHQRRS